MFFRDWLVCGAGALLVWASGTFCSIPCALALMTWFALVTASHFSRYGRTVNQWCDHAAEKDSAISRREPIPGEKCPKCSGRVWRVTDAAGRSVLLCSECNLMSAGKDAAGKDGAK